MNNLKKYLNGFNWYDLPNDELIRKIPESKIDPDYPSTYQMFFGTSPVIFLRLLDKVLPIRNLKKFEKFMLSQGFELIERGFESFKYIDFDRKITISGDAACDNKRDDDDDDNDYEIEDTFSQTEAMYISILPTMENKIYIEKLIKNINKFLIDVSKQVNRFYMIAQNQKGFFTQKTNFKSIPIKDDRYDLFYGKKFPHEKIKKFIEEETENLILLHGDPGTGKSNYIKHIITNSKKKIIYIPPSMLTTISSPGFITFMMENKNSILLIEDAEEVLSIERNSATNNLLGLTDGFLKDALGLKVIATFNCDIGKIDPALLRKGRMFFEYNFNKLSVEECVDLSNFLEMNKTITEPMTLADFFNEEDNHVENSFEERRIGFV
jgi:hypothetical protein